ncbi:hypothetical protein HAX54_051332 [Datura stramonium]|uniref:Uncharacterized protein n=1 Tax=Datura stramonium TaxID=4076 RepID=A0ABS8SXI9_DATST|nr:hypothetical protein [Datura stramonium]
MDAQRAEAIRQVETARRVDAVDIVVSAATRHRKNPPQFHGRQAMCFSMVLLEKTQTTVDKFHRNLQSIRAVRRETGGHRA